MMRIYTALEISRNSADQWKPFRILTLVSQISNASPATWVLPCLSQRIKNISLIHPTLSRPHPVNRVLLNVHYCPVAMGTPALFRDILDRFAYPDVRKYEIAILGNKIVSA